MFMSRVGKVTLVAAGVGMLAAGAWAGTPWQQFHGGADHVGAWDGSINVHGIKLLWSLPVPYVAWDFNRGIQPTLSSDGRTLFLYSDASDNTGTIHAISTVDGQTQWTRPVYSFVSFGHSGSPVYDNGYVYWAGSDSTFDLEGNITGGTTTVYRMRASDGSTDPANGGWASTLDAHSVLNASCMVGGGKVFISRYGGMDGSGGIHYALDAADGTVAWAKPDGGHGTGAMTYDAARGLVYQTVRTDGHDRLRAYNAADGSVAWTANWGLDFTATAHATQMGIALRGGRIYVQSYDFGTAGVPADGQLFVADAANSGALLWSGLTANSGNACPAVDPAGNVYVAGGDWLLDSGHTRAYGSDGGDPLWTSAPMGGYHGSPAWADGYVFSGDQEIYGTYRPGTLYLLNAADGTTALELPGGGPVGFGRSAFYTLDNAGNLYAYAAPIDGDANYDDVVDYLDLGALAGNYRQGGKGWEQGDFTGDGMVDYLDLGVLAGMYRQTAGAAPEPATLLLMLAAAGALRRRK